ncbi:DUF4238 domain-containing protein [Bradyrhizobium sp. WSM3983]|uniref:DUF4238 domain-containing protein n=1 Tax=Bradyrhizobium sp. WSM3983 TaxID=1038867 RepID=UPI0003F7B1BC|nr:DUF4238 domain-containing protein [Bradyrhizobium sp. WSM3983]
MARKANAKIQHYVPQYYLRGFVNQRKQLYVVDRQRAKFFRVPANKVGGELYFNLVAIKDINPFAVEEALSEMEGQMAPVLDKVKSTRSLGDEKDRNAILNLIASVTLRNPKQRAAVGEIYRGAGQLVAGAGLETKDKYAEFVAAMAADGLAAPAYEEMKGWFKNEPELFKPPAPPKEFNILVELQWHDPLVKLYDGRKWQMLVADDDSGGFVTSDHPVCLRWADGQDHGNVSPGFSLPGTEVIFPLSPKLALHGRFDGEENAIEADRETVAGINSLLISNCNDQVFGRDALFYYRRGPTDEVGSGAHLSTDEVFLAGGKNVDDGKVLTFKAE